MRILALALLLVTACSQGDGARFPLSGGGGGGGGGGGAGPDANMGDSLGSADVIAAKVCLVTDPRSPDVCSTASAAGFTVTLDGHSATTAADGTFVIDTPTSSNLVWTVIGNNAVIITSVMSFSAARIIPVMKTDDYINLQNESGVVKTPGYGDVFIHVGMAGMNVATVVAAPMPTPLYAPQYDGTTATSWQVTGTGSFGMVWLAGLPAGTASTTLTPTGGTATVVGGIPVVDNALTWVNVELP